MVFVLSLMIGGLGAWVATQVGFYKSWVLLLNLVTAIYLAVFLTPLCAASLQEMRASPYGSMWGLLVIAGVGVAVLHNACLLMLPDSTDIYLPKVFDQVGAGIVGFINGMLGAGFLALLVYVSPAGKSQMVQQMGLPRDSVPTSIAFLSTCCNVVHKVVGKTSAPDTAGMIKQLAAITPPPSSVPVVPPPSAPAASPAPALPPPPLEPEADGSSG